MHYSICPIFWRPEYHFQALRCHLFSIRAILLDAIWSIRYEDISKFLAHWEEMTSWVGWGSKILLKKLIIFFFYVGFYHFSIIVTNRAFNRTKCDKIRKRLVFCNMKYIGDIFYNLPIHFFPLWKMNELLHGNPTEWLRTQWILR